MSGRNIKKISKKATGTAKKIQQQKMYIKK